MSDYIHVWKLFHTGTGKGEGKTNNRRLVNTLMRKRRQNISVIIGVVKHYAGVGIWCQTSI